MSNEARSRKLQPPMMNDEIRMTKRALAALALISAFLIRHSSFAEEPALVGEARLAIAEGIPEKTLLNINIPKGEPKGTRITKQGFKVARPIISEHIDPRGKPYFWIGELREGFHAEGGTDFEAIDEGFVSITPMRTDLTNYQAIDLLKSWEEV